MGNSRETLRHFDPLESLGKTIKSHQRLTAVALMALTSLPVLTLSPEIAVAGLIPLGLLAISLHPGFDRLFPGRNVPKKTS